MRNFSERKNEVNVLPWGQKQSWQLKQTFERAEALLNLEAKA